MKLCQLENNMTTVKEVDDKLIRRLPAEIGTYLININLDKALTFLDEAMLILPNERYCVFNRAIARKKSMNIRAALDDVSAALKLDPQDLRVHAINNEIIFLRKHFEKALILNDRFSKLRSQPDDFRMGHLKCMNAVVNAIHQEYCAHPLRDHFKVIRQQAWQKSAKSRVKTIKCKQAKKRSISFRSNTELLKHLQESSKTKNDSEKRVRSDGSGTQVISTISSSQDASEESIIHMELRDNTERKMKIPKLVNYPFRPLQDRTSNIENYISERYLEKLHWQKLFLKKLTSRKGFEVPNKRQEEKIKHVVDKCHKHLCNLQELLRSCKPFYHIKYQEKKNAARSLEHKKRMMKRRREETNHAFSNIYRRLNEAYDTKNLRILMITMENLVELYSNLPKSYIEEQWNNIAESFKILRNGYFTFGLFSQRMSEEDKINRIKVALGLEMQRVVSNDSFFNNLKQYHPTDWRAKIKITEERLESARYIDEIIYFNYELARFHLEIGKPEFAHSFARRCVRSAKENQDVKWLINGMLLMAKANIRNNNKIDTIKVLEKTLHISRTLDCAAMVEFLTVALNVVQQVDFTTALDARGVILKRQKQILHLLKDNEVNRMKAEVLFKKISFIPAKRTMSMIPGIKIVDNIQKEKTSRNRVKSAKPTGQERRGIEFYDYIRDFVDV